MTAPPGSKILLVDDDIDICRNLTDILTDLGYQVDAAYDGPSALDLVRKSSYDVALLDLKMPGMDGLELYREIKKERAGTVALIVTAYASAATTKEALMAGAWRVLSKPVNLPDVLRLVDQVLNQPLVLVVDDDRSLCANLWDLLRDRGYRVGLAYNSSEAVAQLRDAHYKVVLIDMKIPDGNGGEVFLRIREADPKVKTILITGYPLEMDDVVARVLAEGADAVCYKPFDVPKLLGALQTLAGPGGDAAKESASRNPA